MEIMAGNPKYRRTCYDCGGDGIEKRSTFILILMQQRLPRKDGKCLACDGAGYVYRYPEDVPEVR